MVFCITQRSYQIITANDFYVHHKIRRKHNQHSKLSCFKINLHFGNLHIRLNIYIWRTKLSSHTVFIWSSLLKKCKEDTYIPKYTTNFFAPSEKKPHKPFKLAVAKRSFASVYIIDTTCFDEYFLFHAITRGFIVIQIYRYLEVWCNRHVAAFFETSILEGVCILYPLSPQ